MLETLSPPQKHQNLKPSTECGAVKVGPKKYIPLEEVIVLFAIWCCLINCEYMYKIYDFLCYVCRLRAGAWHLVKFLRRSSAMTVLAISRPHIACNERTIYIQKVGNATVQLATEIESQLLGRSCQSAQSDTEAQYWEHLEYERMTNGHICGCNWACPQVIWM